MQQTTAVSTCTLVFLKKKKLLVHADDFLTFVEISLASDGDVMQELGVRSCLAAFS